MDASADNKHKYVALGLTIAFHAVLFLIFIWVVFVTPIPAFEPIPVPELEIGLEMSGMGNRAAGGSGNNGKEMAATPEKAVKPTPAVKNVNTAENIVTDETEQAVMIKTNPKNIKKIQPTPEPVKVEEEKASAELLNTLQNITRRRNSDKGEGTKNIGGGGTGTSTGFGDKDGKGIGDGPPGGNGPGGYDLKGRRLERKPQRMTDSEEEGVVVVEIIVDETGRVIQATPGQKGSTTTSAKLYAKARQAAKEAKFNPSPNGTKEQRGSYTFVFTLE